MVYQHIIQCFVHHVFTQEPSLRATQYLPDIVKLQRSLYDAFNHRLDRNIAKTHTIDKFLRGLRSGMLTFFSVPLTVIPCFFKFIVENSRNEYRERIASLKKAFALVGNNLKTHSKILAVWTVAILYGIGYSTCSCPFKGVEFICLPFYRSASIRRAALSTSHLRRYCPGVPDPHHFRSWCPHHFPGGLPYFDTQQLHREMLWTGGREKSGVIVVNFNNM